MISCEDPPTVPRADKHPLTGISHKRVYMNHPKSRQALTTAPATLEFLFFAAFRLLHTDSYILISFIGVLLFIYRRMLALGIDEWTHVCGV